MAELAWMRERLVFYEQFWKLLGDLHVAVFTVDPDRRITSFNRAAEFLTGYREKEVIGRYCHEIFQNDLCQDECKYHEAVKTDQEALSFEVDFIDRNRERRNITKVVTPLYDGDRKLVGCIEVFQDRSAFEELISRIRYGERQLKIILDNLDIGVFTVTRGGLITFFNTQAELISGYGRKEVIGKPSSVIFGEESEEATLLRASISDGRPRCSQKGLLSAKDRAKVPVRARYMALRNEKGRIMGGLATLQDLSLIHQLNRAIKNRYTFADMIGKDPAMQKIFEIVPIVAASEATILIEGPTGTGKDLLARVIHNQSSRCRRPLVKVNCAAVPDTLLESEMFGYVRGAFTGAERDKPGRFQEADGGTIFLDEVGDLPLALQAKLLRVLEDKEFYPLGGRRTTKVDARIMAATNQDLTELVRQKRFREDLFYRLNVIRLQLPPLKERKGDLPLLIDHIVTRLSGLGQSRPKAISREAMEVLLNYEYPGNVRELENILEHAFIICQGQIIGRRHLPLFLQKGLFLSSPAESPSQDLAAVRETSEKEKIFEVLNRNNWNRTLTARQLNMDRTTLWRKMKKYHLSS